MKKVWRHVHGPRPIAALVPVITRAAFARSAPGTVQLMDAWEGIVGPALAKVTMPRRMIQGTLTIACSGPVAMELQYLSEELLSRINQYLGSKPIQRLRFLQTMTARPVVPPRPPPTVDVIKAADAAVAGLPEGPLRDALASLGRAVLTECARDPRLGKPARSPRTARR